MDIPLLFVLIDGWRHDLLSPDVTPFLHEVSAEGLRGSLVEPFGFAPGPAIFAGLWPDQAGYTHKFHYDPKGSPYRFTRWIPELFNHLPRGSGRLRVWIMQRARRTLVERGCTLPDSVWEFRHVPFRLQHFFDLSEFHRPDAPGAFPTPGLFDLARSHHLPYLYLGAPATTLATAEVLAAAADQLTAAHRLIYAHFGQPDWTAHTAGPGSEEHLESLREVDSAVSQLHALVTENCGGGQVNLLAFGDHGFVSVTQNIDVSAALADSGLRAGKDYVCFLDSTMARFWFPNQSENARQRLIEVMDALAGLTRLEPDQAQRYRASFEDVQNWDECWVAESGTVIHPDFFQPSEHPLVKGMHGYRPEVRENHAAWALAGPGCDLLGGKLAEPLAMPRLFDISCRLLGLPPVFRQEQPMHYTIHCDALIDARIQRDLDWIKGKLLERLPELEGLILAGSFARGEGTVIGDGEGGVRPFNDYDLVVIHPPGPQRDDLVTYSRSLSDQLGFRHLDTLPFDSSQLQRSGSQMFFVDLRAYGRVLHGDPELLSSIPPRPADSLPLGEARVLLFNRLTCGLENSDGSLLDDSETDPQRILEADFMSAKLVLCAAHARLLQRGRHATSTGQCLTLFGELYADEPEAVTLVERYIMFKLDPVGHPLPGSVGQRWSESRDFYLESIRRQLDLPAGDQALIAFTREHCRWSLRSRLRLVWHRLGRRQRSVEDIRGFYRHRDIEAAELLVMAAPSVGGFSGAILVEAARRLRRHGELPAEDWDTLRERVVALDHHYLHLIR